MKVNFKVAITEMYPRITWELVEYPFVSADYTVGTTGIASILKVFFKVVSWISPTYNDIQFWLVSYASSIIEGKILLLYN
jgi:hypothetical protein